MKITATSNTMVGGISIMKGTFNYAAIDHKKPSHREELRILRNMGIITFKEILEGDKDVRGNEESVAPPGRDNDRDIRAGGIPDEGQDESSERGEVAKRRNGAGDKAGKVRRKGSGKTSKLGGSDKQGGD